MDFCIHWLSSGTRCSHERKQRGEREKRALQIPWNGYMPDFSICLVILRMQISAKNTKCATKIRNSTPGKAGLGQKASVHEPHLSLQTYCVFNGRWSSIDYVRQAPMGCLLCFRQVYVTLCNRGQLNVKRAPPSGDASAKAEPPCCSRTCRTMASPSP